MSFYSLAIFPPPSLSPFVYFFFKVMIFKKTTNKSISLFPISSSPNRDEENPPSAALSFPCPPFLPPHRLIKSLWSQSPGVGRKEISPILSCRRVSQIPPHVSLGEELPMGTSEGSWQEQGWHMIRRSEVYLHHFLFLNSRKGS